MAKVKDTGLFKGKQQARSWRTRSPTQSAKVSQAASSATSPAKPKQRQDKPTSTASANKPIDRAAQVTAVLDKIEAGQSERSACEDVGIHRNTFRSAALSVQAADQYARATASLAHYQAERAGPMRIG